MDPLAKGEEEERAKFFQSANGDLVEVTDDLIEACYTVKCLVSGKGRMVYKNSLGGVFVLEGGRVIHQKEQKIMASLLQDDAERLIIQIHDVRTPILRRLLDFISFHLQDTTEREKKAFNSQFIEQCSQILCELASAAYYLDHKPLVNLTSKAIASQISGKTTEELREVLGTQNEPPMPASMTSHLPARFRLQAKVDSKKQKQKLAALAAGANPHGLPGIEAPPSTTQPIQATIVEDKRSVEDILAFLGEDSSKSPSKSKKGGKGKKSSGKKTGKDTSHVTSKDTSSGNAGEDGKDKKDGIDLKSSETDSDQATLAKAGEESIVPTVSVVNVNQEAERKGEKGKNVTLVSQSKSIPAVVVVKGGEKRVEVLKGSVEEEMVEEGGNLKNSVYHVLQDMDEQMEFVEGGMDNKEQDGGMWISKKELGVQQKLKKPLNLSGSSATSMTSGTGSTSSYIMPGSSVGSVSSMGSAMSQGNGNSRKGSNNPRSVHHTSSSWTQASQSSQSAASNQGTPFVSGFNPIHQIPVPGAQSYPNTSLPASAVHFQRNHHHLAPAMCMDCQNSVSSCVCPSFIMESDHHLDMNVKGPGDRGRGGMSIGGKGGMEQGQERFLISSSSSILMSPSSSASSSGNLVQHHLGLSGSQHQLMRSSSPSAVTFSPKSSSISIHQDQLSPRSQSQSPLPQQHQQNQDMRSTQSSQTQQTSQQNILSGSMLSHLTFPSPFSQTSSSTLPSFSQAKVASGSDSNTTTYISHPTAPQPMLPPFPSSHMPSTQGYNTVSGNIPQNYTLQGQGYVPIQNFFPSHTSGVHEASTSASHPHFVQPMYHHNGTAIIQGRTEQERPNTPTGPSEGSLDLPPGLEVMNHQTSSSERSYTGGSLSLNTHGGNIEMLPRHGMTGGLNEGEMYQGVGVSGGGAKGSLLAMSDPASSFAIETSSFNFPILTSSSSSAQYYWGDDDEYDHDLYMTSTSIGRPQGGQNSISISNQQIPLPRQALGLDSQSSMGMEQERRIQGQYRDYETELEEFRQSIEMDLQLPFTSSKQAFQRGPTQISSMGVTNR